MKEETFKKKQKIKKGYDDLDRCEDATTTRRLRDHYT